MAAKLATNVALEGVSHHCDSAKAAIRQATTETPTTHERLCRIYDQKVSHKLEANSCHGRTKYPSAD